MSERVHFLLIGDVIGRPGRRYLQRRLPQLRKERPIDLVVVNVENAAGGFGVTPEVAQELRDMGVDVMTSGNHIYDKKEILAVIDESPDLLRPANYPDEAPGRGVGFYDLAGGITVAVINLQGRVLMPWIACPFEWVDRHLDEIRTRTPLILLDMHAEATAEKNAMAWHVNQRVTVIYGTHTHIPTADARILPGGHTAYITDVGMTGPYNSVIGMNVQQSLRRLRTMFPRHLDVAKGPVLFSALYVTADARTGQALSVEHLIQFESA